MRAENFHAKKNFKIKISGRVQGVGFRPFVYRIAIRMGLTGTVDNRPDGVYIELMALDSELTQFKTAIVSEAPQAALIQNIVVETADYRLFDDFRIVKSIDATNAITEVSPDIAVCPECLSDMENQASRIAFPFINCTNCGPRFTIIRALPYDRPKTSMHNFPMCEKCNVEYTNILDRRFHAQPIACNNCGPTYEMAINGNKTNNINRIIEHSAQIINSGGVIALKGMGGYNLVASAETTAGALAIRAIKKRDAKPFALMARNIEVVAESALLTEVEKVSLASWNRPIVLLECMQHQHFSAVNGKLNRVGVMLPYMPFQYMLFSKVSANFLIFTSGNFSDEPIIIDNESALTNFSNIIDAVITYNRDIVNRNDDSVGICIDNTFRLMRRSRGFVPEALHLNFNTEGIFAAGAELVNCFAVGKGTACILSQHIGDIKNTETFEFYSESFQWFSKLFRFKPEIAVCDLHPDYNSSKFAETLAEANPEIAILKVQHHYAHIAACMAEYGITDRVIGLAFDGSGLGTDGNIWGSEFLIADLYAFERFTHFEYVRIPGGDIATKEVWRSGLAYLFATFGNDIFNLNIPFLNKLDIKTVKIMVQMINSGINSPLSCSTGRLFDAVAAITEICTFAGFHAQAPMLLENDIEPGTPDVYAWQMNETVSFAETIKGIVTDIKLGVSAGKISAKFHNTIIEVSVNAVCKASQIYNIKKIVLSGGSFQNKYVAENIISNLNKLDFEVFLPAKVPANDGGLALGQMYIAAARRQKKWQVE